MLLICVTLLGCGLREYSEPVPRELIDSVAGAAALLPTNLISEVDESGNAMGSTPRYIVIVRHVSHSDAGHDVSATTNVLQEWVSAYGYGDKGTLYVDELRKRALLDKASYRVGFTVDRWTDSNAVVSVGLSYPERGGQAREWTFIHQTGTWIRVKDESKGWWD